MTSTGAPVAGTIAAGRLPGANPSRFSPAQSGLIVLLLLVGVADLAVLDAMVLPRYLALKASAGVVVPARNETAPAPIPLPTGFPAPPAPQVAEIPAPAIPTAETPEALRPLLFWRNASLLTEDAQSTLSRLRDIMAARPALLVRLSGHTDDLGPVPVNRVLSWRRARAAQAWLVERGIDKMRIEVQGLGATMPVDGVVVPSARAKNRRVEIEFR